MERYGPSIDAETAHRLLDGEAVGPPRLASLLASVAYVRAQAPAGPLAGEERAVAAYRAAQATHPAHGGRGRVRSHEAGRRRVWSRALAIKLSVAAFVLSGGGVAVAAAAGVIPNPLPLHLPEPRTAAPPGTFGSDTPGGSRGSSTGVGPSGVGPTAQPSASALPADINGLCHAWPGDFSQDPSVAEHNPRYAGLIATAGGVDKVSAYCQAYLASRTPGNGKSSGQAHASDHPSQPPATAKGGH